MVVVYLVNDYMIFNKYMLKLFFSLFPLTCKRSIHKMAIPRNDLSLQITDKEKVHIKRDSDE